MSADTTRYSLPRRPQLIRVKVMIRHIIVKDDSDPGPGKGEFDVTLGACAGPPRMLLNAGKHGPAAQRASYRWQRSVWSGYTYDVRTELGPIAVSDEDGWITVAGAGVDRDPIVDDQVRGGLAMLGRERRFGMDHWWRTTNGLHFDIVFTTIPAEASSALCPRWNGDILDAPCPTAPTEAEYRAVLSEGFDRRQPSLDAKAPHRIPERELKHTYIPAYALMASEGFLPPP